MIARRHRFHGHTALRFVYQNGRSVRSNQLLLKYALNDRRTSYRLAVVVAKKVSKSAVTRNRIRRRLYEASRSLLPPNTKPYDLVITVFSDQLATMPATELQNLVTQLLKEAQILPPKPQQATEGTRARMNTKEQ